MIKRKYILFGAGDNGKQALRILGGDNVICFCDNKLHGQTLLGKIVLSLQEVHTMQVPYIMVITPTRGTLMAQIALQLREQQISFLFLEDVYKQFLQNDITIWTKKNKRDTFSYQKKYAYPILTDRFCEAGKLNSYFWQDLWAARKIYAAKPGVHCDIGSRIDGFIAHLCAFGQTVHLLDIRPLATKIPGVKFVQCDATNLDAIQDESIESLSALCSLEHFGLGRYGDPIDPEACFKCFAAIQKKIRRGGRVYISVPVGKEHLEYNAHRVFYASTIVKAFKSLSLSEYSVTHNADIEYNVDIHKYDDCLEWGGERFGLFAFEKA